jgi:AcrR family transcriptional regulator
VSAPGSDLSLSQIVDATVQLLDERGVAGFTMRALGERLGRSAMAAYRHVSDRDTLLKLAAEAVQQPLPETHGLPWYERLEAIARHGWQTSWRPHPWLVDVIDQPANSLERDRLELVKQTFRDAGFDEEDTVRALIAHWAFVIGTLHFLKRTSPHGSDRDPDAVFEFNLRAWVLGLEAKAAGRPPGDLRHS